jgi:hypothetical protein
MAGPPGGGTAEGSFYLSDGVKVATAQRGRRWRARRSPAPFAIKPSSRDSSQLTSCCVIATRLPFCGEQLVPARLDGGLHRSFAQIASEEILHVIIVAPLPTSSVRPILLLVTRRLPRFRKRLQVTTDCLRGHIPSGCKFFDIQPVSTQQFSIKRHPPLQSGLGCICGVAHVLVVW